MSTISIEDVMKLARLSALSLNKQELEAMRHDLSEILTYVAQLDSIDTDNVIPTYQVHGLETVTRADTVIDYGVERRQLLANAPTKTEDLFEVPRVIE